MSAFAVLLTLSISAVGPSAGMPKAFCQGNRQSALNTWELRAVEGVPCRLALILEHSQLETRHIFVLLEDQYFKTDSLKRLFQGLAMEYGQTARLNVTAFSDAVMLQKAIDNDRTPICLFTDGSTAARQAARKFAEEHFLYPTKTGYFRAFYSRSESEEELRYSPNADKESYITLTIKAKEPEPSNYTGVADTDLVLAAEKGDLARVQSALAQGANINARNSDQRTALHKSIIWGHAEIANFLITRGADVNQKDKRGVTSLMLAAESRDVGLVRFLLAARADVNAKDDNGATALISAVLSDRFENVRALVAAGADVSESDVEGDTPLILAATSPGLMRMLIASGAEVNATNDDGYTALMFAAKGGCALCVKTLLATGANLNKRSKEGLTALKLAREHNQNHIVQILNKAGAIR